MNLKNKVILVTGGTGSFGNAFVRKVLKTEIKEVRIFSRDEKKQDEMRSLYKDPKLKFFIGDVRDIQSLEQVMIGVDLVFHAAAIKQVPSAEFFPLEAVKTNVLGSYNVINLAIQNNVQKVICLSTDKAAYPINAMGISKAMMERVASSLARGNNSQTEIITTRYGNVIGSRGSVIPVFLKQLANDYLTITDPNMTRFLMSLDEAIDLVLYAIDYGQNGDLFVKKSNSAKIIDLANAICRITGKNVEYKYMGPRHSEKYHETLLTVEEFTRSIDMGEFFRVPLDNRDLNYDLYNYPIATGTLKDYNSSDSIHLSIEELVVMLKNNFEVSIMIRDYLNE